MNLDCQRWAKLVDLEALGERLASDQAAFLQAHAASCQACAREARVLLSLAPTEADVEVDETEVQHWLSLVGVDQSRRAFARRWKGALVVAGGVAACAAAALLWVAGNSGNVLPRGGAEQARSQAAVSAAPSAPQAAPASSPARLASSPPASCSRVIPGATVCLADGASLARQALSGPHRELEVARGHALVSLEPQAPGTSFSLTTATGKVTAVGTIFSVDVGEDGTTVARVLEGKVLVRVGGEDASHAVTAGQAFRFGDQQPTPLSEADRGQERALLSKATGLEPALEPSASAGAGVVAGRDPTPTRNTLELARALRASGDLRGAVDVYRKIHTESPRSPSGRAALLSMGDLLLSLHDPAGALNAFDAYLVGGGALSQEAMFGRVRALRALNRPSEEERAIQRFLSAYPDAPQSRPLRVRLTALQQ